MGDLYVVTAPYVVPKVRDRDKGGYMHRGYYQHAVIDADDIDPDSLRHHLEGDMMAPVETPEQPAEPAQTSTEEPAAAQPADPDAAQSPERPVQAAPKADWVAYAVAVRGPDESEQDSRTAAEATSKADLIARYGG